MQVGKGFVHSLQANIDKGEKVQLDRAGIFGLRMLASYGNKELKETANNILISVLAEKAAGCQQKLSNLDKRKIKIDLTYDKRIKKAKSTDNPHKRVHLEDDALQSHFVNMYDYAKETKNISRALTRCSRQLLSAYDRAADIAEKNGKLSDAMEYEMKADEMAKSLKLDDRHYKSKCALLCGEYYEHRKDLANAQLFLDMAFKGFKELNEVNNTVKAGEEEATVLVKMGKKNESAKLHVEIGDLEMSNNLYYEALRDYKEAQELTSDRTLIAKIAEKVESVFRGLYAFNQKPFYPGQPYQF